MIEKSGKGYEHNQNTDKDKDDKGHDGKDNGNKGNGDQGHDKKTTHSHSLIWIEN